MNKKLVQTDFLNPLYHPVKMNIVLNKTVKPPPFAPRNPNKEPMPKYGHIQFGETAARTMDVFNNKRKYVALQDPRKMYQTEPMPVGKFLNAGTVKRINMGRVAKFYSGVKLVSKIEAPIINVMKDSNMKLITLEMLKNAITGVKYDKALGTQQQQLQAKTAYDNLIVQYSALVDRKLDTPQEVKNIINAYERELEKVYGRDILKKAPEKQIETLTASINTIKGSLEDLYNLISSGKISDPRLLLQQEREAEEEVPEFEELTAEQIGFLPLKQRGEYRQRLAEYRRKERLAQESEPNPVQVPENIGDIEMARLISPEDAPAIAHIREQLQDALDELSTAVEDINDEIENNIVQVIEDNKLRIKKSSFTATMDKADKFRTSLETISRNITQLEDELPRRAKLEFLIADKQTQSQAILKDRELLETNYNIVRGDLYALNSRVESLRDRIMASLRGSPSKGLSSKSPSKSPPQVIPSTPPQVLADAKRLEKESKKLLRESGLPEAQPSQGSNPKLKEKLTKVREEARSRLSQKEKLREMVRNFSPEQKDEMIKLLMSNQEPENWNLLTPAQKELIIEELKKYEKTKSAGKKAPSLVEQLLPADEPPPSFEPAVPYEKIPEVWANKYSLNANPTLKDLMGVLTITDLNEIAGIDIPPENLALITQTIYENILKLEPKIRKIIYDVFRASFIKRSKGQYDEKTMSSSKSLNLTIKENKEAFENNLQQFLNDEMKYLTPYTLHIARKVPSQAGPKTDIPPYSAKAEEEPVFGQGRRRRKSKAQPKSKKITHKNIRKMQDEIMRVLKG